MTMDVKPTLASHFDSLPDRRLMRKQRHDFGTIIIVAICAEICGCDDWVAVTRFANAKLDWFKNFVPLANGTPSHDTFSRVFSKIDPKAFSGCFTAWVNSIAKPVDETVMAIDGKTLLRSFDRRFGAGAIHMISAWSVENQMVLGQVKVKKKSNEIAAISELLRLLAIKGAIVTIEPMGCQKAVAKQIIESKADYVLVVKGNQPSLHAGVDTFFKEGATQPKIKQNLRYHVEEDKNHGRREKGHTWTNSDLSWVGEQAKRPGLKSIAMVASKRTIKGGKTRVESCAYISSVPAVAAVLAKAVRTHWQVENNLHWTLDIAFREDECDVREGNGAANFVTLRPIALNLSRKETTAKAGVKTQRLMAGWGEYYLLKVIGF